jgi:multiple sugar transport system substrate-binding protein
LATRRSRRRRRSIAATVVAAAGVLAAVGGSVTAANPQSAEAVTIRWFVGLGTGAQPEQIEAQEGVVAAFNEAHDDIELEIEIVDNEIAFDTLATQIAAGDAPDIIGPLGIRGSNAFAGQFLDLQPYVDSTGYDLSAFEEAQVEFWREESGELTALPFAVYPSMIYYNVDLFDEAGLEYPPAAYGEPYADGDPWDMDKLMELALLLTVDANGNDGTSPDFDPDSIVQFGFGNQFTDMRGLATLFGAGNLVDEDGNAMMPEHWREALAWHQELAWTDHSHPFADYMNSDTMGGADGNWFNSGNIAMSAVHLWYATCCIPDLEATWNVAPVPAANGQTTAKMHADTFAITEQSEHPTEAFAVLSYLLGEAAPELLQIYGGMPARLSLQDSFFSDLEAGDFAGMDINWDLFTESMAYNDRPNHEAGLPSSQEAQDCYNRVAATGATPGQMFQDPSYDLGAALDQLVVDLQAIYDGTGSCTL